MAMIKGTLIPIGGNEDKGFEDDEIHRLDYVEEGILAHVVAEAGGINAKIVVIPTASSIPIEVGKNYSKAFSTLGCKHIDVLNITSKKDAESTEAIALIKNANCVMFSGGDQSKISKFIGDTPVHHILLERFKHERGFVVAGTSAGAMAMANEMIAGGSSTKAFIKGAVIMRKGLGLIPELVIDTHFIQRGRFGRLAEAVAKFPKLIGIGLAEDTGLIIKNGNEFKVIGSGMVIVFNPRKLKHNNEKILKVGTPMSLTNLKTHVLANGDRFNIKNKKVKVLPVKSPFI
jgi:cyanophycinase